MYHDKRIVKQLVEILAEANQTVPDWLESCKSQGSFGGGSRGGRGGRGGRGRGGGGSRFGATDARHDGPSKTNNSGGNSSWSQNTGGSSTWGQTSGSSNTNWF